MPRPIICATPNLQGPPQNNTTHQELQRRYVGLLDRLYSGYQQGIPNGAPDIDTARSSMLGAGRAAGRAGLGRCRTVPRCIRPHRRSALRRNPSALTPMTRVSCGTAILGAGSAGLAAALALSGRSRVRIIAPTFRRPRTRHGSTWCQRPFWRSCWSSEFIRRRSACGICTMSVTSPGPMRTPETVHSSAVAHVERPALELALLAALERMSGIRIVPSPAFVPPIRVNA